MADIRMGSFQSMPPVVKNLLIVNGLVFFAQNVFANSASFNIDNILALHDVHSPLFRPHQLITHMFMHGGFWHLFFNMFALWMFGSVLENVWGSKRFLIFFMSCGLGAALLHLGVLYNQSSEILSTLTQYSPEDQMEALNSIKFGTTVGASGAVFGCLAAYGYLFPNNVLLIYGVIPLKAKWFVIIYAAIELFSGVRNSAGDNVAHWAHLGGALVGFILVYIWNRTDRRRFY